MAELANDPLIGPQGLIIREYIPLETLEIGINRMPITNEWRLFFYKDSLLASGYYWAIIDDETKVDAVRPDFEARGIPFAKMIAGILAEHVNFFVIDIARTAAGEWKVVEVNDAQQSALNYFVPADELYANLAVALAQERRIFNAFEALNLRGTQTGRISSKDLNESARPQSGVHLSDTPVRLELDTPCTGDLPAAPPSNATMREIILRRAQSPVGTDPLSHFDSAMSREQILERCRLLAERARSGQIPNIACEKKGCPECSDIGSRPSDGSCNIAQ